MIVLLLALGCSEYRVDDGPRLPPADPPDRATDIHGNPPDWATCNTGLTGRYYNLGPGDPMVGDDAEATPEHPEDATWWPSDALAFVRFDPSLDFGANWWPVDEGIEDDPDYFSVAWTAWLRVRSRTTLQILLGAADDAWVLQGDEVLAAVAESERLEPEVFAVSASPGQFPLSVFYTHRRAEEAGFRFRIVDGDAVVCPGVSR